MNLIASLVIVAVLWFLYSITNRFIIGKASDSSRQYNYRKILGYSLLFLGVVTLIGVWSSGFRPFLTVLGLVAAALTITHKEVITNFTGLGFILWRKLFSLGDRIQIGFHQGDVIGLGVFYFSLMEVGDWAESNQSTGRIIKIPNHQVIGNPVINYTRLFPYIWHEIPVTLTVDSDWEKASLIMERAGREHSNIDEDEAREKLKKLKDEMILYKNFKPKVYLKMQTPLGVTLSLRYLCLSRQRRDSEDMIGRKVLKEFAEHEDVTLKQD